ncbi:hypothetical protein [Burkholderia sp. AW49-1]
MEMILGRGAEIVTWVTDDQRRAEIITWNAAAGVCITPIANLTERRSTPCASRLLFISVYLLLSGGKPNEYSAPHVDGVDTGLSAREASFFKIGGAGHDLVDRDEFEYDATSMSVASVIDTDQWVAVPVRKVSDKNCHGMRDIRSPGFEGFVA